MPNKAKVKYDLNALYPPDPPDRLASARELQDSKILWNASDRFALGQKSAAAWMATKALLLAIGGMSTVAYLAAMPGWLVATGAGVAGLTWLALYKLLREWSAR